MAAKGNLMTYRQPMQAIRAGMFMCSAISTLLFTYCGVANNISVTNTALTDSDHTNDFAKVQFDLSWDNSWRNEITYDAAWIFVKYRTPASTGDWAHATLSTTGTDHTAPTGATISPTAAGTGVFIYRNAVGNGSNSFSGVKLRWNYGTDGVSDTALADIRVFAIEMILVPEGAFAAGSGGAESSAFTLTTINTAAATTAPTGSGSLGGQAGGYPTGQTAPDNDSWPNGFAAFYCMKYEITQGQYAAFLNSLTATQASARNPGQSSNRYAITGSHPNFTASAPDRACNYLSWPDGVAYLDWSCLRPMTELEFEKACRGAASPVANEHAWGDTSLTNVTAVANAGTPSEVPSAPSGANAIYGANFEGPLRVGSFATAGSTRVQAGASFYGIMELTGNVWERTVIIGDAAGRSFTGLHGDGALGNSDANVTAWPDPDTAPVAGFRGGSWVSVTQRLPVSDRGAATFYDTSRNRERGFRGVRSAPAP